MNKLIYIYIGRLMFLSAFLMCGSVIAQENKISEIEPDTTRRILIHLEKDISFGGINILQDERLDVLLRKHISYNDSVGIQGWKILIYNGRELKTAQDAGALYNTAFPESEMPYLVDYQAPDFKTLVGAFRTREEAYRFHQQIKSKKEFKFSYLVHAKIRPGELK